MTDTTRKCDDPEQGHAPCMLNRRQFLLYSSSAAAAASTISVSLLPGTAAAQQEARVVGYPRKLIAKLSELKDNVPLNFNYPDDLANATCMLVKMGGLPAGGGVGDQRDIVAYSYLCTHQGGPLHGTYKATDEHRTLGPCPLHLSLFDLRRHGVIASGQAYESLPQVLLEIDGDDIYAVGMLGLIFGRDKNLMES